MVKMSSAHIQGKGRSNHERPSYMTKASIVASSPIISLRGFFSCLIACRPKENQVVEPCLAGENMNETLCLKHGCCPSYKGHVQLKCFGPLKDRKWHSPISQQIASPVSVHIYSFSFCHFLKPAKLLLLHLASNAVQ